MYIQRIVKHIVIEVMFHNMLIYQLLLKGIDLELWICKNNKEGSLSNINSLIYSDNFKYKYVIENFLNFNFSDSFEGSSYWELIVLSYPSSFNIFHCLKKQKILVFLYF